MPVPPLTAEFLIDVEGLISGAGPWALLLVCAIVFVETGLLVGFLVGLVVGAVVARREDEHQRRVELGEFEQRRRAGQLVYVDFTGRHLPPAA